MEQIGERYLAINSVGAKLDMSRTSMYRTLRDDPTFPEPVLIRGQRRWRETEIDAWVVASQEVRQCA